MKTIIYYNVNTGEAFDSEGQLRTSNNPFKVSYLEKHLFEWHLVSSRTAGSPANWTPYTDFEYTPSIASITADDSYLNAWRGTLVSIESGVSSSAVSVSSEAPADEVTSTGNIRLTESDGTLIEIAYTAVSKTASGYLFTVGESLDPEDFSFGGTVDILKSPLAKTNILLASSVPANGIFAFSLLFHSERLKRLFEYSGAESLAVKGLELRAAGVDGNDQQAELLRATVPLTIRGILDQSGLAAELPENALTAYQAWTCGLLASGLETQFSTDGSTWSSNAAGALYFRMRPLGVSAAWSTAIPLDCSARNLHYSFTVASGNTEVQFAFTLSALGITNWQKIRLSLFKLQGDDSELDITANQNLEIYLSSSGAVFKWLDGAFPEGTYYIRS